MPEPKMPLQEAIEKWDGVSGWGATGSPDEERARVLELFPLEAWPNMPVDRYALGTGDKQTFCYLLEFATPDLGSIGGGSSRKHLVYRKSETQQWWFDNKYSSVDDAWTAVRAAFIKVFDAAAAGNMDAIEGIDPVGRL